MKLKIYSKRWKSWDTYNIIKTETGWKIGHISIFGDCDKRGNPFLYKNFKQDFIDYPEDIEGYLEYLWEQSMGKDEKWIQPKLNALSKWLYDTEKSSPKNWKIGIWKNYK